MHKRTKPIETEDNRYLSQVAKYRSKDLSFSVLSRESCQSYSSAHCREKDRVDKSRSPGNFLKYWGGVLVLSELPGETRFFKALPPSAYRSHLISSIVIQCRQTSKAPLYCSILSDRSFHFVWPLPSGVSINGKSCYVWITSHDQIQSAVDFIALQSYYGNRVTQGTESQFSLTESSTALPNIFPSFPDYERSCNELAMTVSVSLTKKWGISLRAT